MPLGIGEILASSIGDRRARFVFPSEICASFWLRRTLELGLARALSAERFLGWDSFKELASPVEGEEAPADSLLRWVFSAAYLARNAESPTLRAVVPPAHAAGSAPFAGWIAARLPRLASLPEAARVAGASSDPALLDWLDIRSAYERFLSERGRFEPSYRPRALCGLPGRTILFFPELIEDYEEYAPSLALSPALTAIALPPPPARISLDRRETSLGELRAVLTEAGELLDGGRDALDIAITIPGLDAYRPYLEREAELLSIPIAIRSGLSLAATAGGRFFAALRETVSSGFSFGAMRDLLSSPAWPWKAPSFARGLLAEGARLHALSPWPEGDRLVDPWEASLAGRSGYLLAGYRKLKRALTAMVGAKDFESLLSAYGAFRREFLLEDSMDWDEATDLSLARCVKELVALKHAQGKPALAIPSPYSLFLRALEERRYVPAGTAPGIPVYEWRVAAGIEPERHFVLDSSQPSLTASSRRLDFLPERTRRLVGATDRDASGAFIAAYALSGSSVSFSCPARGFDGERAVHGFISARAEAGPARPSDSPARPSDSPARPSDSPQRPSETPTRPSETPTRPSDSPQQSSASPQEPSASPTRPSDSPQLSFAFPQELSASPTRPSDSPQQSSVSPQRPSDYLAAPAAPFTVAAPRGTVTAPAAAPGTEAAVAASAYAAEAAWLAGRGEAPPLFHAVQLRGLGAAARSLPPPRPRGSGAGEWGGAAGEATLGPETAGRALARLRRKDDPRLSLDATAIDAYAACPYAYLYLRLLGAAPEPSGIAFADAAFLGEIYHAALALLFERVRETESGRFRVDRRDEYEKLVDPCLDEAFSAIAARRGPFVGVVLEAYRERLAAYLRLLMGAESERFPDLRVGELEEEYELEYPALQGGLVLRGRVDRVSWDGERAVIVDYKKGRVPSRAEVKPAEDGSIGAAQIPCYLRLVAAKGAEIGSAWYVSIEGWAGKAPGTAACAYAERDAYVEAAGLPAFLAAFDAALARTAAGIAAGRFPLVAKELQEERCAGCGARGICRDRYALRFGGEEA